MFTFNKKTGETKSVDTGFADQWYTSQRERPNASVVGGMTTAEAYAWVSEIYGAVEKVSSAIRAYPMEIRQGERVVWASDGKTKTDPAVESFTKDLLENLEFAAACVLIDAQCYWWPKGDVIGDKIRNVKFEPLPLRTVKVITKTGGEVETNGDILRFEYTYGGKKKDFDPDGLIYFLKKSYTKRNEPGISPVQNALGPASSLFSQGAMAAAYFNRGGVPVTVWKIDPATPNEERERFEKFLNRMMSGVINAFRNAVLKVRNDADPITIGHSIKETMSPEMAKLCRQWVAISFSFPVSFLDGENGDQSNQAADYMAAYEFCITPLMGLLAETLNEQFLAPNGMALIPLPGKLPVMAQAKLEQMQAVAELTPGQQILTLAAARELIGYATPTETEKEVTTLNGAQVTAALDVLRGMSAGEIADDAALPIIMALGIDAPTARAMVDAQAAMLKEKEAEKPVAPVPPPQSTPEGQQAPEMEDGEEDASGVNIEAQKAHLARWRDELIHAVGLIPLTSFDPKPRGHGPLKSELDRKIYQDLLLCKNVSDIRAVFERHWPRKEKQLAPGDDIYITGKFDFDPYHINGKVARVVGVKELADLTAEIRKAREAMEGQSPVYAVEVPYTPITKAGV